jgi:hypothetical protein
MGFISWLRGKGQSPQSSIPTPAAPQHQPPKPSEKEIFQSPSLLADWVNRFILLPHPLEDDYKLLPDDQTRKNLNITVEQRERCAREYMVLRIAGVSAFIKQHYPDDFWLTFSNRIVPYLCQHLYGANGSGHALEVAKALEEYVDATASKDVDRCSKAYMSRVYDDSDNFFKLTLGGIGFISVDFIMDSYGIFRDAHCQVTQGMSYDSVKAITDALEKVQATKA